jgi:hypothetical protein
LTVHKSNSENSLNNVNLTDSILPDVHAQPQQEEIPIDQLADDFYYSSNHQETVHSDSPIT